MVNNTKYKTKQNNIYISPPLCHHFCPKNTRKTGCPSPFFGFFFLISFSIFNSFYAICQDITLITFIPHALFILIDALFIQASIHSKNHTHFYISIIRKQSHTDILTVSTSLLYFHTHSILTHILPIP